MAAMMEDDEGNDEQGEEFEVEEILRYRRNENGDEYFLVKWVGYLSSEATWEPLAHMNENCRELIAKARALFAWRRPSAQQPAVQASEDGTGSFDVSLEKAGISLQSGQGEVAAGVDDQGGEASDEEELFDPGAEEGLYVEPTAQPEGSTEPWQAQTSQQAPVESFELISEDEDEVDDRATAAALQGADAKRKSGRDAEEAAAPAKRPKLSAPSRGSPGVSATAKGVLRHGGGAAGAIPTPPPTVAPPAPPVRKSRGMKCICGAIENVTCTGRGDYVVCKICDCALHPKCVEGSLSTQAPDNYVCPPCRVERVDEFHPPVGEGLLRYSYAQSGSTLSLSFTAQAAQWRKQQWAVHLRAVSLSGSDLGGPAWPHAVQGKLNSRQCVVIDPPKHLHIRREQCYNLTPLLRQGVNTLELRFTPNPDKPRNQPDEGYCVGVTLTRPRSVSSIISRIKARSTETVQTGRERVARLLGKVDEKEDGDCIATGSFGKKLQPHCPVSFCPIEEAAVGKACTHVQVFDLQAYIAVNQRMRSLDKRWTCPVCSLHLRPDDIMLEPFAQGILDTMRGDEDKVEAVVFNEDCSWTTVSAEKEPEDDEREAAKEAVMIDCLSDDE